MVAFADDLTEHTLIPDLLARWPHTRAVLDRYGLKGCGGASGPAWVFSAERTMCRLSSCSAN
jgi:hypothetical protein